jgi:site-specific DNA-methyltransferase (adenine-specific)
MRRNDMKEVWQGDCLELMKDIPDKSIDMILCDLPYGTTACKWDTIIPFEPLWEQYKRIIKDNGAIVLTASQPFTSALVMSNPKMFKYEWVWEKHKGTNFNLVKKQPFKVHESILIFGGNNYNPQKENGIPYKLRGSHNVNKKGGMFEGAKVGYAKDYDSSKRYPRSVQYFENHNQKENSFHPTQKPVALFEYLIKTYTNEGDLVLDNCAGSGTTGVACINTNRNYILIEKEPEYIEIIKNRLLNHDHPRP